MLRILVLSKRQYTGKDLLDDRFGRIREIPFFLGQSGHHVRGLCLSYKPREEGWKMDGPVLWKSINATPFKIPGLLRFIHQAQGLARKSDVIWACSDSFYGIIGYALSRKYKVPLVFDLYDNFEYFLAARLPVVKQLYRRVLRKCDAVTCVSAPLSHLVASYGRKGAITVLENAVSKDRFRPMKKQEGRAALGLPQNARIVGTAGALEKNRGFPALLEAFDKLKAEFPDIHLALAGPRDVMIPKGERIHDFGILTYDKVPSFLNVLDVAVICMRNDGFGRYCFPQKAREIMACGVPLIAARVGSMELLLADHPSWLFKPEDPEDLAGAIKNRLEDSSTSYSDIPSWSDIAAELEGLILKLLHEKTSSQ